MKDDCQDVPSGCSVIEQSLCVSISAPASRCHRCESALAAHFEIVNGMATTTLLTSVPYSKRKAVASSIARASPEQLQEILRTLGLPTGGDVEIDVAELSPEEIHSIEEIMNGSKDAASQYPPPPTPTTLQDPEDAGFMHNQAESTDSTWPCINCNMINLDSDVTCTACFLPRKRRWMETHQTPADRSPSGPHLMLKSGMGGAEDAALEKGGGGVLRCAALPTGTAKHQSGDKAVRKKKKVSRKTAPKRRKITSADGGGTFWPCKLCGRILDRRHRLIEHMRTHTNERPFKCSKCEKSFAARSNLRSHVRSVHERLRPHKCRHCGKGFSRREEKEDHENIHTGAKPWKCTWEGCDKAFAGRTVRRKHMRQHKLNNR